MTIFCKSEDRIFEKANLNTRRLISLNSNIGLRRLTCKIWVRTPGIVILNGSLTGQFWDEWTTRNIIVTVNIPEIIAFLYFSCSANRFCVHLESTGIDPNCIRADQPPINFRFVKSCTSNPAKFRTSRRQSPAPLCTYKLDKGGRSLIVPPPFTGSGRQLCKAPMAHAVDTNTRVIQR